ncbi:MAG: glycosyltransferase, partial [Candidatus Stahlbacteria bacterium]
GRIDKQDCLSKLVSSVEYMVKERSFRDFKVLIIGDGTDSARIEEIVIDRKLGEYFIFYGSEYNKENLFKILSSVDLCVDPQKESEVLNKSTPLKIMEYMALGKPIVQYDGTEGRFSAKGASLYIENNDEYAFGDAIIYLLNNEKKRKEMGEYGIKRVREFLQWDIQKKNLLKIYREVLI